MRFFGGKDSKSGPAPRVLIAAPEIPLQRAARPAHFIMPEPRRRRGEIYSLYDQDGRPHLAGVFFGLTLAAAVVLASLALKWAFVALHIPFPGR